MITKLILNGIGNDFIEKHKFIIVSFIVILFVSRNLEIFPKIQFSYTIILLLIIWYVGGTKKYQEIIHNIWLQSPEILLIIFTFPLYAILTIVWTAYPQITIWRSLYQLFIFLGIFALVIFMYDYDYKDFIKIFLPANIFIISVSLLTLVFRNYMNVMSVTEEWQGFKSIFGQANSYAVVLLFTMSGIGELFDSFWKRKDYVRNLDLLKNKKALIGILLLILNIFFIWLSYSRAVMLALFIAGLIFLSLTKSYKTITAIILIIITALVLFLTSNKINSLLIKYAEKGSGSLFAHRTILFEPSIQAAELGGLFGLGYGVSAPNIRVYRPDEKRSDKLYVREKGNSVLAIVEETGILGLVLFLLPLLFIFVCRKRKEKILTNYQKLLIAALVGFIFHAQFEAWWVGVGSGQFPLFLMYMFYLILIKNKIYVNE